MSKIELTDRIVRNVLGCMDDLKRRTLAEVTVRYNQKYPPPFLGRKITEAKVKEILVLLEGSDLMASEVFTFFDQPIEPTKRYSITTNGIQYLGQKP